MKVTVSKAMRRSSKGATRHWGGRRCSCSRKSAKIMSRMSEGSVTIMQDDAGK